MTVEHTPTDALPDLETLQVPENGELLTYDNIITSATPTKGLFGKLIDGMYYLSRHIAPTALAELVASNLTFSGDITLGTGKHLNVSSRVETRVASITWTPVGAGFAIDAEGKVTDSGTGAAIVAHFDIPHGVTLNEVHVSINPAGGHGGLSFTKPNFIVTRQDLVTGAFTTIATGTDSTASVGAYEAIHYVSATGLSEAIDRSTKGFKIYMLGEIGGDAENNLVVYGAVKLVYTRTLAGED